MSVKLYTVVAVYVNILERNFQVLFSVVPQLQTNLILGIPIFQQAEMQIHYDREAIYVTFNTTSRLEESVLIPTHSGCVVNGVLRNKVNDVKI